MKLNIRHVRQEEGERWLSLRCALWHQASAAEHREDVERFLRDQAREPQAVLVAELDSGQLVGFSELSIRSYAEGCSSDNVAFLEGWYVAPEYRQQGVARALIHASEQWAVDRGCTEFASDTSIDNEISAAAHAGCGFSEVGVIRCFRKELPNKLLSGQ